MTSKKMRVAILSKHKGQLDIVELPIPEPESHQILVQIKASG
jgi:D-arabinose 1-dehydrogenase-like Zn-dependent alcohol dehydrogenase